MKLVKPLHLGSKFSSKPAGSFRTVSSFAQKTAKAQNDRYRKAIDERKKMIRAQYLADKPMDAIYKSKVDMLDRKINRLK